VVSSCGIAMEQRTTFGKALSVSYFSIAEFFNPYPIGLTSYQSSNLRLHL
jgi:hypothetical protein